ncbi:MAG: hypothetical protein ACREL7_04440 [Longimicrobiales bacterium]
MGEIAALIGLAATAVAGIGGYIKTRSFVARRLRYVDSVQNGIVPVLAGTAAAVVAAPVVALLPFVAAPTAIAFGVGVGVGTRAGVRAIRNGSID